MLDNVSLEVRPGETVAMIGANGAGKSTIMRTLSGLLRPVKGDILLNDRNIARLEAHQIAAAASRWCRRDGRFSPI